MSTWTIARSLQPGAASLTGAAIVGSPGAARLEDLLDRPLEAVDVGPQAEALGLLDGRADLGDALVDVAEPRGHEPEQVATGADLRLQVVGDAVVERALDGGAPLGRLPGHGHHRPEVEVRLDAEIDVAGLEADRVRDLEVVARPLVV